MHRSPSTGRADRLLSIEEADGQEDADWLCKKIVNLRVFDDENGVMNKSILEAGGDIIVVSQFTLMASTKKGNRPSYIRAAKHETAIPLYEYTTVPSRYVWIRRIRNKKTIQLTR